MGLIFLRLLQSLNRGAKQSGYKPKALLTPNEFEFYNRLRAAFPEHVILPQVSMAALMEPTASDQKARTAARNRIAQKRVDYVVANRHDLSAIFLVELDDRTHKAEKDLARDALTRSAGYVTHTFLSTNKPTVEQIRQVVSGGEAVVDAIDFGAPPRKRAR